MKQPLICRTNEKQLFCVLFKNTSQRTTVAETCPVDLLFGMNHAEIGSLLVKENMFFLLPTHKVG